LWNLPIPGTKPKPEHRHRVKPPHEWQEVPKVPFEGGPKLPCESRFSWPQRTKEWWAVVSRMPHCVLWAESDWAFAIDTAYLHAAYCADVRHANELRQRERIMGTTMDARRDLRIRYVESLPEEQREGVTAIDEYRQRLIDHTQRPKPVLVARSGQGRRG
jgi:hypothetical protein